ncbi:MAG TPA: type I-C CRISPR-associated protein Cas8c/Csd1, partial [Armatimonadetes bacterium]|nr:type I-C CRISPR-associated protein Cas8c/Csd1 [Armatimonadota bacterium]
MRAALRGAPLPSWLLAQAVNRCRAEQDVTYPRAALIRAVLVGLEPGKEKQMSSLEPNETRPAYLCGRLLAVLEQIQNAANPGINTTLVDRFYGAASTAPASVFGNLLSDAQAHLSKLRRTRASAYQALQKSLEAVLQPLPEFPHTLTLQEQALFSLGYYHQRAEDRAAARERKAANEAAKAENATEGNDNE